MRRRVLDLCLLAYPRLRRERDRDYLRDLALELSDAYGFRRQALSLLRGGLRERAEGRGPRSGASVSVWMKRVAVTCFVLAGTTFGTSGLLRTAAGAGERVDVDRFACSDAGHPPGNRDRMRVEGLGGCAAAQGLVAARRRAGWDCAMRRSTADGQPIAWRCTL